MKWDWEGFGIALILTLLIASVAWAISLSVCMYLADAHLRLTTIYGNYSELTIPYKIKTEYMIKAFSIALPLSMWWGIGFTIGTFLSFSWLCFYK